MSKRDNHDDYSKKLKDKYGEKFSLLSRYTASEEWVKVRCNDCGNVFSRQAGKLLCLGKCRGCWRRGRTKTQQEFIAQIKERHNGEITVVGDYSKDSEKVLVRHEVCGAEYEISATAILQNLHCRHCANNKLRGMFAKTHDGFIEEVNKKHGDKYTILDKYHNAQTKLKVRHNECGYEWEVRPVSILLQLKRCPNCSHEELKCVDTKTRRMVKNIRSRIIHVLRGRKKSASTLRLVGVESVEEIKMIIESKFGEGMTWDNYGEWQIDHARPCASFDLNDPNQQKECFHHSNMQPMWKEENIKKNSIYNGKRHYYGGDEIAHETPQAV